MARQERRAEAGGEFRFDADQPLLGAGDLGGIARQEVVHRLVGVELGDRRHHAKSVGGQEDDVLRVSGAAAARGVGNELHRISRTGVLGLGAVVVIGNAGFRIEHHVFQHGTEVVGGVPYLRLGFLRELDRLGIAAALEIEDAVRAPAVLVVAEQNSMRIGRQRGLAGAGQAEKQRALAFMADVSRAVHRHDALRRQVEIERGEYRFLDLTRVRTAADQHDLPREIDRHHGVGAFAPAVAFAVGLERRQIDDGQFGHELDEFGALGADQELMDEQRMPGQFSKDAGLDLVFRIGAAVEILREQFLALAVRDEVGEQRVEVLSAHLAIAVPPHRIPGEVVDDRILVLRRAAGVMAGLGTERAARDDRAFARCDGMLVESRFGQIPVNGGELFETEFVGAIGAVPHTRFLHAMSSQTGWAAF